MAPESTQLTALLRQAADAAVPETHLYRRVFRSGLGAALAGVGRRDEAEAVLTETVSLLEARLGADHRHTRMARERLDGLDS
jgi:hypothetical protein